MCLFDAFHLTLQILLWTLLKSISVLPRKTTLICEYDVFLNYDSNMQYLVGQLNNNKICLPNQFRKFHSIFSWNV